MKYRRRLITCAYCGELFKGTLRARFCSYDCRYAYKTAKQQKKESLCWSCEKACGNCSWSKGLVPIPGWEAKKTQPYSASDTIGYFVMRCPEYKKGRAKYE